MLRSLTRFLYSTALIAVLGGALAYGQQATGRISGQVTDPNGRVIPAATVQIVNQDTLVQRTGKTDATGAFDFLSLSPGHYQLIVEADGFERKQEVVTLVSGQAVVFDARMSVRSEQTQVEVVGAAAPAAVETDTASISTTIGQEEVTGYGLNGRNFSQLITMSPGVSNQTGQDEAKVGVAGSAKFSVNGGRVEYNTFEVDGSDVLNTSINASRGQGEPLMVYPSVDAIQEMKVLTADYSALYGKSASGSVLINTKSGTDKFHGSGYGFLRNEMFNARNYFDQPDPEPLGYTGRSKYRTPLYRRLDFGGTIGGPLYIPHIYNNKRRRPSSFSPKRFAARRPQWITTRRCRPWPSAPGISPTFAHLWPGGGPGRLFIPSTSGYTDCPRGQSDGTSKTTQPKYYVGSTVKVDYISKAILDSGLIPEPNSSSGCNAGPIPRLWRIAMSGQSPRRPIGGRNSSASTTI